MGWRVRSSPHRYIVSIYIYEQSAVDYIQNGRAALVKGLQNILLIKKNVRQRGLFRDSEVNSIFSQSSPRSQQVDRLLGAAVNGGEDVCYELLRILDDTRHKTFPKPAEGQPDLHQWISCFTFGNDPHLQSEGKVTSVQT